MADFNPQQTLPGNVERISVAQLTKNLEEAKEQATQLANKASNIWRKMHPEDEIKTKVYDPSDFLNSKHQVVIPPEVEEMFQEYENWTIEQREKKEQAPTADELKKLVKGEDKSVLKEEEVKKNPVFSKLMNSFGLKDNAAPKTVSHNINGMKITFEYPSSLITNFALAYASSEGIGTLDFGFNMQIMTVALSIVEIDDVPVTKVLNLTDDYEKYSDIPAKVRKVCGVRMCEFLRSISDKDLEKFMSFYSETIGFVEDTEKSYNANEFVEIKCPKCGKTELIPVTDNIPDRYCRDDGSKMEVQSSNKTDNDAPLE